MTRFLRRSSLAIIIAILVSTFNVTYSKAQTSDQGTSPQCITPPSMINVQIRLSPEQWPAGTPEVVTVPFDDYIFGVVMGELGPIVPQGPYVADEWSITTLEAQSVVARTFATYFCTRRLFSNGLRGLYNDDYDQVYLPYDPDFSPSLRNRYIAVSNSLSDIYMTWDGLLEASPYNGKVIDAQYRSDVGDPSCSWRSGDSRVGCHLGGPVTGYEYLAKANNPFSIGYTGGPGWAQTPSEGWLHMASQVPAWPQLLEQYYTGIRFQHQDKASFLARYWNNVNCSGGHTTSATTKSVNYDWGNGSPIVGIGVDNFCVKWTSAVNFQYTGWNTFWIVADDGVRLKIDGVTILDKWAVQTSPRLYSVSAYITQGNHNVELEYFSQTGGAAARLSWYHERGMIGAYYDTVIPRVGNVTQPVVMQRPDIRSYIAVGMHSPLDTRETGVSNIQPETFSIKWNGNLYINECQNVEFSFTMDDGGILTITHAGGEQEILIDEWRVQSARTYKKTRWLCPGTYPLEARYFEETGNAVARVSWSRR